MFGYTILSSLITFLLIMTYYFSSRFFQILSIPMNRQFQKHRERQLLSEMRWSSVSLVTFVAHLLNRRKPSHRWVYGEELTKNKLLCFIQDDTQVFQGVPVTSGTSGKEAWEAPPLNTHTDPIIKFQQFQHLSFEYLVLKNFQQIVDFMCYIGLKFRPNGCNFNNICL